jgi:hypothetical protein
MDCTPDPMIKDCTNWRSKRLVFASALPADAWSGSVQSPRGQASRAADHRVLLFERIFWNIEAVAKRGLRGVELCRWPRVSADGPGDRSRARVLPWVRGASHIPALLGRCDSRYRRLDRACPAHCLCVLRRPTESPIPGGCVRPLDDPLWRLCTSTEVESCPIPSLVRAGVTRRRRMRHVGREICGSGVVSRDVIRASICPPTTASCVRTSHRGS